MTDLILRNLTKTFPHQQEPAVDNLDLEIREGDLVALLGPSGCGKSTTLRMIAGLETASSGEILIGGRDVASVHPKDRGIGLAFENYALYPPMTVRENLSFNLTATGINPTERAERIDRIARMLHIDEILEEKPRSLSSGQKQRVNIARAMVRYPKVLLLDEPLSHLDPRLRSRMRTEIKRLQTEMRFTTVLVTHDQMEAMALADRVAVLDQGRLQQFDEPMAVFSRPANEFVAAFLGEPPMNILSLRRQDDRLVLAEGRNAEFSLSINEDLGRRLGDRDHIRFGIRPQNISLHTQEVSGHLNLAGTVSVVENLGDASHVGLRFGDELFLVHLSCRTTAAPGDRIICAFESHYVSIF